MDRAVIYEFHNADPAADRIRRKSKTGGLTIVLVGDASEIPTVAAQLVEEGVGLIELCGGVPLTYRAQAKDAVGSKARVASVTFGIESIVKAAEFNQAFMAGHPPAEACLLLAPDAEAGSDRIVRSSGSQVTTFVITDERSAVGAAGSFAEQGVGLMELYGGFSDHVASAIIEAVAGRAAVGLSGFGLADD